MSKKRVFEFSKEDLHAFNYYFLKSLEPGEYILKMPRVTPNKRGVNDIGFACDDGVTLFGTFAGDYEGNDVIWLEIQPFDEVNKTISYIKIRVASENSLGETIKTARINIRAILN